MRTGKHSLVKHPSFGSDWLVGSEMVYPTRVPVGKAMLRGHALSKAWSDLT